MTPEARARVVDALTTHRHGEERTACRHCANYYGGLLDVALPLILGELGDEWADGDRSEISLPSVSDDQVSDDLVWLTEELHKRGAPISGGLLGGEFGYGAEFENETFMMHPFCWCERDDCAWCWGCECPDDAYRYLVGGQDVGQKAWLDAFDVAATRDARTVERVPDRLCDYCKGLRVSAPNFLHKPSGTAISWYEYIGRSMETDIRGDWRTILAECAASVTS